MHRGHLDMSVATTPTMLEDAARVISNAKKLLGHGRSLGIAIIHVKLVLRLLRNVDSETTNVPFWQALQTRDSQDRLTPGRSSTVNEHNLERSPGTEIIPELFDECDYIIANKRRLDCFIGTDLDILLQSLGVRTICVMGINTNTCVLNTAFTAFNVNLPGGDFVRLRRQHVRGGSPRFCLQNGARCIGWVLNN
jgi:biuret amidohydrolase